MTWLTNELKNFKTLQTPGTWPSQRSPGICGQLWNHLPPGRVQGLRGGPLQHESQSHWSEVGFTCLKVWIGDRLVFPLWSAFSLSLGLLIYKIEILISNAELIKSFLWNLLEWNWFKLLQLHFCKWFLLLSQPNAEMLLQFRVIMIRRKSNSINFLANDHKINTITK